MRILTILGTVLVVCLLTHGCLVGGESSKRGESGESSKMKISVDDERYLSFTDGCLKLLDPEPPDHSWVQQAIHGEHIVVAAYQHEPSCVNLYIGWYTEYQRMKIEYGATVGSMSTQKSSGNYKDTMAFLDKKGITCKQSGGVLSLVFPEKHRKYDRIELKCGKSDSWRSAMIGLNEEDGDKLVITTSTEEGAASIFHAFDTDTQGRIIKHVKVVGNKGHKDVRLND